MFNQVSSGFQRALTAGFLWGPLWDYAGDVVAKGSHKAFEGSGLRFWF